MADIGTKLPFENLDVTLAGKPYILFGEVTIIGNRTTWKVVDIECFGTYGAAPLRLKPGTELFETVRVALHQQFGQDISARLNIFVEERGGYAILYGEEMPTDRYRRGIDRYAPPERTFWLDAA